jgi:hypothetical protein
VEIAYLFHYNLRLSALILLDCKFVSHFK